LTLLNNNRFARSSTTHKFTGLLENEGDVIEEASEKKEDVIEEKEF